MKITVLERLLTTERLPRRADESTGAGFAVPALQERAVDLDVEPLLVTNMRGSFVPTVVSRTRGVARFALDECLVSEESSLLREMIRVLNVVSQKKRWGNRCRNLAEAAGLMKAQGLEPRTVVVPYSLLESTGLKRADADELMTAQGYVTLTEGVQVLPADLEPGQALVAAAPALTGFYTRSDDRVGIMLTRANRALFLVDDVA
jgi:hypothetical protein